MSHLVQVEKLENVHIVDVKQYKNTDRDRPAFSNKYLKFFYFIRFEGIRSTLRKYFAHSSAQCRYLTFLTIEHDTYRYINVSTQFQTDPNKFVVANEFYRHFAIDFPSVENELGRYFTSFNQFCGAKDYDIFNTHISDPVSLPLKEERITQVPEDHGLLIYGLGGYVKMFIIHHFKTIPKLACVDYNGESARGFQSKYRFKFHFLIPDDSYFLLKALVAPTAIIATYHSDHASIAHKIFNCNPNSFIFIEKPPIVSLEDLDKLIEIYNKGAKIEIGFNRRFIKFSEYVRDEVQGKVVVITCSVKEVNISSNHWYLWKNQGTRITGNGVHWFDLANFWIQSSPTEINLMPNPNDPETFTASVLYKNGSILNITASDKGNSLRGVQENIEIRYEGHTIFIDDFISLTHTKDNGIKTKKRNLFRDKGHNAMYKNFTKIIDNQTQSDYTVVDLIKTSVVTFYASYMSQHNIRNFNIESEVEKYLLKTNKNYNMVESAVLLDSPSQAFA